MALSDLAVYSEYAYSAMTEVLAQQINLFNGASGGTILLSGSAYQGDYSDLAFYANVSGLVRRRNPYGTGTVAEKTLKQIVDTMVKVAAGTPPVRIDPGQFRWIQRNPQEAGAVLGQQLAIQILADMLNTGLGATVAALKQVTAVVYDAVNDPLNTTPAAKAYNFKNQNRGQAKFGDRANDIAAWITHSTPVFSLYENSLTNAERLFQYGTVNVNRDPFGRIMVVTDSPSLVTPGATPVYHNLGLTPGSLIIGQNNDFDANEQTINGQENIVRTYQAEWSYQLGIKGFSWDKANGGKAPTDASLLTSTNWDQYSTSIKDIAGVVVETN